MCYKKYNKSIQFTKRLILPFSFRPEVASKGRMAKKFQRSILDRSGQESQRKIFVRNKDEFGVSSLAFLYKARAIGISQMDNYLLTENAVGKLLNLFANSGWICRPL